MSLHITTDLFAVATKQGYQTASRRLRYLPHTATGPNGVKYIPLTRTLSLLKLTEDKAALPVLFDGAKHLDCRPPPDAERIAERLSNWLDASRIGLTHRQASKVRFEAVQRAYAQHIVDALETTSLARHTERLRRVLILDDRILRYVTTGDQSVLPANFRRFALEFAIQNAQHNTKELQNA